MCCCENPAGRDKGCTTLVVHKLRTHIYFFEISNSCLVRSFTRFCISTTNNSFRCRTLLKFQNWKSERSEAYNWPVLFKGPKGDKVRWHLSKCWNRSWKVAVARNLIENRWIHWHLSGIGQLDINPILCLDRWCNTMDHQHHHQDYGNNYGFLLWKCVDEQIHLPNLHSHIRHYF